MSVTRPVKKARHRLSKVANARDTIAGFGPGLDIVGLTHGQFSLLDLIQATLDLTGPADVDIATWSVGLYDADAAHRFVSDGRIRQIRFVMDSTTPAARRAGTVEIADLFGQETIRVTRSHAKFAPMRNDQWKVTITSSMNLNLNPRVEQFEMTEDAQRCAFFTRWVDTLFEEIPPGPRIGDPTSLPTTRTIPDVKPDTGVTVGTVTVGRIME